jgi:hypothetical protein
MRGTGLKSSTTSIFALREDRGPDAAEKRILDWESWKEIPRE